ncbi:hypothetical protein L1987_18578 [Smallanthus sonchifolius]|uniref:Uncharacterized protein n=1 Tax=Smallanthus sonchifolius TaxID=185202 RepID=A0ACB9J2C0_9ASTR|nr:hypothetical protein L1987_18578 [Smallanthus sonchifolius]
MEKFENSSVVLDYFNSNADSTKRVAGIRFIPPPFNANYVVEPEIINEEEIDPKTVLKVNPVTGEDMFYESDSEDEVFDGKKVEGIPKEVKLDEPTVVKTVTRDRCILTEPDEVKVVTPKLSPILQSSGFVDAGHQKVLSSKVPTQVYVPKKSVNCSGQSSEAYSSDGSSNSKNTSYFRTYQERRVCFHCNEAGHILVNCPYKNQGKLKTVPSQPKVQDKLNSKSFVCQDKLKIPHVRISKDSHSKVKLFRPQRRRRNRKLKKILETSESDNNISNNVFQNNQNVSSWKTSDGETSIPKGQPRRTINNTWYVDSGCSRHMTGNIRLLEDVKNIDGGYVAFAGNKGGYITGQGTLKNEKVKFGKVNYVEQLEHNLLSVSQVCHKKFSFHFNDAECYILKPSFVIPDEWILMKAPRRNDTYVLEMSVATTTDSIPTCLLSKASESDSILWHRKLAHSNYRKMNYIVKNDQVLGIPKMKFSVPDDCIPCKKGKQRKKSHKSKSKNSIVTPLELLHMDLFGPISIRSIGGKSYCFVVTDDFSRFSWVKFLFSKAETTELVQYLILGLENLFNLKVRRIRSDNGSEFKNSKMSLFYLKKGIHHEFSAPYVPQQNGVAERKNRTLVETAHTMLADSKLPVTFWAEAVNTACHVLNRVLTVKRHNKTCYELLNNRKPNLDYLLPFGYVANSTTKRVYNKETRQVEEWFHIDCSNRSLPHMAIGPDWAFDYENLFKSFHLPSDISPDEAAVLYDSCQDAQHNGFLPNVVPHSSVPSTSTPDPNVASCSGPQDSKSKEDNAIFQDSFADPLLGDDPLPSTQDSGEILTNLDSEIPINHDLSYQSDTTHVEVLPVPEVASIKELKDHPVTNIIGNLQDGVKTRSIVDNTCLYTCIKDSGVLDDCSHSCFISQVEPKNVEMALNDNNWIEAMQEELAQFDKLKTIEDFESVMKSKFEMSAMGELSFFLGLQVNQKEDGFFIHQSKYVKDILSRFKMEDCTPYDTPIPVNHKLNYDPDGKDVDCRLYRAMIGSLMYLTASRPDIMFVVCICSRFQAKPKESHLITVKRIFRYLKGKQRLGLWYPHGSNFDFNAYNDSDFGGCCLDRKSTTGGCQFLGTPMLIDNNVTMSITNNPVKHSKTKHIEIRYHFIRDCVEKRLIELVKVHTDDNFANLFTKAFDRTSWILIPESADSHYTANSLEPSDSESS